jgi:hypothetical protein
MPTLAWQARFGAGRSAERALAVQKERRRSAGLPVPLTADELPVVAFGNGPPRGFSLVATDPSAASRSAISSQVISVVQGAAPPEAASVREAFGTPEQAAQRLLTMMRGGGTLVAAVERVSPRGVALYEIEVAGPRDVHSLCAVGVARGQVFTLTYRTPAESTWPAAEADARETLASFELL